MNASLKEEENEARSTVGPGRQLKAIREAQGLELPYVAAQLHLNDSVLEALEADDYAPMAGNVFVQGYLRNYARLVGVDVDAILDSFAQTRAEDDDGLTTLRIAKVKHEVRSSHAIVRMMTWLIVISLIGLLVVWWRGYLQWPLQLDNLGETSTDVTLQDGESAEVVGEPAVPVFNAPPEVLGVESQSIGNTETLSPSTGSANDDNQQPESVSADGEGQALPVSVVDGSTQLQLPVRSSAEPSETTQLSDSETQPEIPAVEVSLSETVSQSVSLPSTASIQSSDVSSSANATGGEASETVQATGISAINDSIVVSFSGACWIEIRSANGSYRKLGNQPAGSQLVLSGKPPYSMVFGNAAAVSITVNGDAYDLAQHTRGNVAKFSLEVN